MKKMLLTTGINMLMSPTDLSTWFAITAMALDDESFEKTLRETGRANGVKKLGASSAATTYQLHESAPDVFVISYQSIVIITEAHLHAWVRLAVPEKLRDPFLDMTPVRWVAAAGRGTAFAKIENIGTAQ